MGRLSNCPASRSRPEPSEAPTRRHDTDPAPASLIAAHVARSASRATLPGMETRGEPKIGALATMLSSKLSARLAVPDAPGRATCAVRGAGQSRLDADAVRYHTFGGMGAECSRMTARNYYQPVAGPLTMSEQ